MNIIIVVAVTVLVVDCYWMNFQVGKTVPANTTYPSWLASQPVSLQNEVFGKKRSALFRKQIKKGKSPTEVFRQFVRSDGTELSLEELERLTKNS